jgi:hypothetical protein
MPSRAYASKCCVALAALSLGSASGWAQYPGQSLSAPLGDPLSGSLSSDSAQDPGLLGTIEGGQSLLAPTQHSAILDPLGTSVFSGTMNPLILPYADSFVDANVQNGALTDPELLKTLNATRGAGQGLLGGGLGSRFGAESQRLRGSAGEALFGRSVLGLPSQVSGTPTTAARDAFVVGGGGLAASVPADALDGTGGGAAAGAAAGFPDTGGALAAGMAGQPMGAGMAGGLGTAMAATTGVAVPTPLSGPGYYPVGVQTFAGQPQARSAVGLELQSSAFGMVPVSGGVYEPAFPDLPNMGGPIVPLTMGQGDATSAASLPDTTRGYVAEGQQSLNFFNSQGMASDTGPLAFPQQGLQPFTPSLTGGFGTGRAAAAGSAASTQQLPQQEPPISVLRRIYRRQTMMAGNAGVAPMPSPSQLRRLYRDAQKRARRGRSAVGFEPVQPQM